MRFLTFLLLLLCALTLPARTPVDAVNRTRGNLALKGYDPVGYFKESKPVKGSPQIAHSWMGATWRFASSENREMFRADPGRTRRSSAAIAHGPSQLQ